MPLFHRSHEPDLPRHLPLPTGPHAVGYQVEMHVDFIHIYLIKYIDYLTDERLI